MRKGIWLAAIALFFAVPRGAVGQQQAAQSSETAPAAQQQQSQAQPTQTQPKTTTDTLAEAARKAREARKNAPKAATVFTNDNIPTTPGAVSVVGTASAPVSGKSTASTGEAPASSDTNGEAAWRKKFADARHKLEQDQAELSIMQRELSQLQLQYYPDPTKALMQSVDRSDIIKKQQAITDKQEQIDADQQAISNLEDELRKAGGNPGWARE